MRKCPVCNGTLMEGDEPCQWCDDDGMVSEKDYRYLVREARADADYEEEKLRELDQKEKEQNTEQNGTS